MSDSIEQETQKLTDKLIVNATEQLKQLRKAKAMSKLAKDMGQDTKTADRLIAIAETALKDIVGKQSAKK